ncbi:SMI1/KNR4 family protein [Xanthomonas oryzae]|nr:SMI1/KNR4 family protein [Xanthomonas oryzae]
MAAGVEAMNYDKIKSLVARSSVIETNGGIPPEWIASAERELGFLLPDSYRWWLENYGDTAIAGRVMLTLAPPEFRDDADIDLVYVRKLDLESNIKSHRRLYFFLPSLEESFAFDLDGVEDGEYPVIREDALGGDEEVYADNFAQFITKQILEYGD